MTNLCFQCGKRGKIFYGYIICDSCKSKLRLFTDETIKKYSSKNPEKFSKEMKRRLDYLEKDCTKKKIKLLHILERLKHIKK